MQFVRSSLRFCAPKIFSKATGQSAEFQGSIGQSNLEQLRCLMAKSKACKIIKVYICCVCCLQNEVHALSVYKMQAFWAPGNINM